MSDRDSQQLIIFAVIGVSVLVSLGIQVFICIFLSNCYKKIPAQFRLMEPNQVWLLFIPCFAIVWNFMVYQRLAKSYKAYFDSIGDDSVGDCGLSMATAYCVLVCVSIIPYLGACFGIAALVTWIIFLVKAAELRKRIPAE